VELTVALDDGHYHVRSSSPRTVRELPRQLSVDELAELFEGRTRSSTRSRSASTRSDRARAVVTSSRGEEKIEVLDAHPAIGQRAGLSARSAAEQGPTTIPRCSPSSRASTPSTRRRHGFRFVVFVNRRPKARDPRGAAHERIDRPTDEELETALDELVAIARTAGRGGACRGASTRTSADGSTAPPLAARDRRDRVDRSVVLLRRSSTSSLRRRGAEDDADGRGRRARGRCTAAASTT
jgi:2-oxo-4-hydroxy-4-carboxy--5-ureidoimidazoline (OHCU) decarboxylase